MNTIRMESVKNGYLNPTKKNLVWLVGVEKYINQNKIKF